MLTKFWNDNIGKVITACILVAVMALCWKGLQKNPIISQAFAYEKAFPEFALSDVRKKDKAVTLNDIKGEPFVVHIWASWCGACLLEHPFWVDIRKKYEFPLIGILYRDGAKKIIPFLAQKDDPYQHLLTDPSGAVGLDLGIVGVPATFVVDAKGKICYAHFGEVTSHEFEENILPLLRSKKAMS